MMPWGQGSACVPRSLHVLEVRGDQVKSIVAFMDPTVFALFADLAGKEPG
jgi:hypothetical protein